MGILGGGFLAGFLFILFPGVSLAQSNNAQLIGRIMDNSGGVIAGAQVVVVNEAQGFQRRVISNDEGYYYCLLLPEGIYRIGVSIPGFQPNVRSGVRLGAQQTVRVDFILDLGKISTSVEIADRPDRLNGENGMLGDVRSQGELLNLPVNDRSTLKFLFLSSSNYQGKGSSFSIGGLRGVNTNFTLDGVSSNSALFGGQIGPMTETSLESVRELRILSSNNLAEMPGVATVMVSSRSGETRWHGSAFFLSSNSALNARNPFAPERPHGPLSHEFGGSLGGPLVLPSLYDGRHRSFFYFTWEQQRFPGAILKVANVPTLKMLEGDFSELLPGTTLIDPVSGLAFPENLIPRERLSPVSLKMQAFGFLPPNYGPANEFAGNWRAMISAPEYNNRYAIRVDHQMDPANLLSARLILRAIPLPGRYDADLPIFRHHQDRQIRNFFLSETHIFSANLLNEFRFGYSRDYSRTAGIHPGATLVTQFGLEGINLSGKESLTGVPTATFVNFSSMQEVPSSFWMGETFEFLDDINLAHQKHAVKAGALVRRNRGNTTPCCEGDFGTFAFDGFATGFDYADFLLGLPQSSRRYDRSQPRYNRYSEMGFFLQDDYQVSQDFSLNLGIRYEYFSPPIDKYDMRFGFDPATGNLVLASDQSRTLVNPSFPSTIPLLTAQQAGFPPRSLLDDHSMNFGPRLGFAHRFIQHAVIRGGYGIYFTRLANTLMESFAGGPFQNQQQYQNQIEQGSPLFQFPHPFPQVQESSAQNISPVSRNLSTPYTQQWNLTAEYELPGAMLARLAYRGFTAINIPYVGDINKPRASTNPEGRGYFRYPAFYRVNFTQDGGIQKMNALDVAVERKFSSGLTFQTGWTWAKNLTDAGDDGETGEIENPYDRHREMGNVYWTPRHRFVGHVFYRFPWQAQGQSGDSRSKLFHLFLCNWQASAIAVLQTGQLLTPVFSGSDPSNTRTEGGRPDQVGNPALANPSAFRWFNPAAFAVPAAGRYGSSARGVIVGPSLVNLDFGLYKHIPVREKLRLQLRVTATNVLNHPNLGNPNVDITSLNVGKITSLQGDRRDTLGGGPRAIQLGVRLDF